MPLDNSRFKLGRISFDFGSDRFDKAVTGGELTTELNQPSEMSVRLSLLPKDLKQISISDLPDSLSVKWLDRGLFQGTLAGAQFGAQNTLILVYRDGLQAASKVIENGFIKKQTLQETLQKMVDATGLSAKFSGTFSDEISAYSLSERSVMEHWQYLSLEYGFHFVPRSFGKSMHFIKLGEGVQSASVDVKSQALSIHSSHAAAAFYDQANVHFFDPSELSSQEKTLSQGDLYGPLGVLKNSPAFKERQGWVGAKGNLEEHASTKEQFDSGDKRIKNRLSRLAVGNESVTVTCLEPLALPGDMLQVSNSQLSPALEGKYLVHGVRILVNSSRPRAEITGVRA